jgi:hypothetical protein
MKHEFIPVLFVYKGDLEGFINIVIFPVLTLFFKISLYLFFFYSY